MIGWALKYQSRDLEFYPNDALAVTRMSFRKTFNSHFCSQRQCINGETWDEHGLLNTLNCLERMLPREWRWCALCVWAVSNFLGNNTIRQDTALY